MGRSQGGSRSDQKADQGLSVQSDPVSASAACFVRDSAPSRIDVEMTGIINTILALFEY